MKIKDFTQVTAGQSAPQDSSAFGVTGHSFIRAGSLELLSNNTSSKELEKISEQSAKKYKLKLFPSGTVIFAKSGMSAKIGRVHTLQKVAYITSHLAAILPSANHNSLYLKYYFLENPPSKLIPNEAYPSIKLSEIELLEIPLPPLEEQKRIANILDKADAIIQKRKESLVLADEYIKSVFLEMFGDPVTNPMGWKVRKLKNSTQIITGNTPPRSNPDNYGNYLEWIKTDNIINDIYLTKASEYLSEQGTSKGRVVPQDTILMACIAGSIKSIGRVSITNRKVAFNQQINAIIPIKYNLLFLYQLFKLSQTYIQSTVNMSLKGILSKGKLEELEFILPPIPLQKKFADIVEQNEKTKEYLKQQLSEAEILFKALQQDFFG